MREKIGDLSLAPDASGRLCGEEQFAGLYSAICVEAVGLFRFGPVGGLIGERSRKDRGSPLGRQAPQWLDMTEEYYD